MITTKTQFKYITGYSVEEVQEVLSNIDTYYYSFSQIKKDEEGKPKIRNRKVQIRIFNPSKKELRDIQNKVQSKILSEIPLIENIRGGVKGVGNLDNAAVHKGKTYRFQTDIKNFFPSVSSKMIFNSLKAKGFSNSIAKLISKIVTYNTDESYRNDCLPQGNPTSTTVANLVMENVALRILKAIIDKDITFTVWVDDLTFSSMTDFS